MKFVLFEKLSELEGKELIMFLLAAAVAACILVLLFVFKKHKAENAPALTKKVDTRALVYGALCLSLSYVLSFIKLFSMPMGGSLTLCSLLPLAMYAWAFGPKAGFTAAFAYSLLQVIQGAWVVHPVQFVLDYFVAFTAFGLASLFPRCLPLGVGAAGLARYLCSVISGVVFFADGAAEAGYESALLYSLLYNGGTIGLETVLSVAVAFVPGVVTVAKMMNRKRAA